jgi:glycerate-2-kinase
LPWPALEIRAFGITLLSAGTDRTDGPTDGGRDHQRRDDEERVNMEWTPPISNATTLFFFKRFDSLQEKRAIITGPTGTNVMDLQIICVEKQE